MSSARGGDQYQIVGQIGEGAFGLVYYARGPQNRVCAIKSFKSNPKDPPVVPAPTIREVHLLTELSHENVLNLLHVQVNHAELALSLVFDYAEHDLDRIIRHHKDAKRGKPIPPRMVKSIAWQMLNGLAYLHENDVMHRDLKPQNILIMGDGVEHGVVKIADFGLARRCRSPPRPLIENGPVVTLWYRAPELLLGAKHYLVAVDIWAVGAILGELLTLSPLFRGVEEKSRDMYDRSQLERIFAVLGPPTEADWPDLPAHPFWPRAKEAKLHLTPVTGLPAKIGPPEGARRRSFERCVDTIRSSVRRRATAAAPVVPGTTPADAKFARSGGSEKPESYPQRQIKPTRREEREREPGDVAPRARAGAAAMGGGVSRLSGSKRPATGR